MPTEDHGLPPLDADAGLVRRSLNDGDQIIVEVRTAGEALDETTFAWTVDHPDDVAVAPDGRPIAIYYSPGARAQLQET